MTAQVILVEAQPALASTGAAVDVRLAGGGAVKPYYYGGNHYQAGITGLPTIIQSLDFEGGELGTGGVPSATELRWSPAKLSQLASVAAYYWNDAPITVRIGPEGTYPGVTLSGKVLEANAEDGSLRIALADPAADLKKPFPVTRYLGTGGLEGPAEWEGTVKRRLFGRVWNVRGEPIDKANNIYGFADPTKQLQSIDAVRDKGAPAASLTNVAWAGTAAATLAALQATVAPQGGGVICPSIACVKWWTQPAGDLTADLKGEIGTGYVETTAEIVQRLVTAAAGPAFAAGTVATAAAARPAPVGWVIKDENTSTSAMLDELLGNSSLLWVLSGAGEIIIREWAWGASAANAKSHDVSRKSTFKPLATRKLGYRRNELVQARGDLAGIVLAEDVDGLEISARYPEARPLNPAEGSEFIDATGRRYRFEGTVITSNGVPITSNGSEITSSGWVDVQDQAIPAAQAAADAAQQAAALAQTAADLANAKIADIAADNIIDAGEKRAVKLEYDTLAGEQVGLDAQATSFAITTEKTAYDTAISALTTYLATLTTPTLWSDTSGKTDIVSATFRAKFQDAYTARTALMTKIAQVAATQSTWTGTTGKPSNVGALTGGEAIQNTQITVASGNIQGIGTGNGTTVANSALQANADGTVSYFNGTSWINLGAVTIVGMGGGALAFLNAVNPATGQVLSTGSVPPSIPDNSFSYTSNTNSVTITWPALTIYRADGTTIAISSGSQAITGLASATTYRVYPYVADSGGTTGTISFVTGGSGSPTAAFASTGSAAAAAAMYGRGNIPMGNFNVATTSSGSGGGGGGGSGFCLHPKTSIMTDQGFQSADTLRAGMMLRTPDGWSPIVSIQRKPASRWIGVEANMSGFPGVVVTTSHVFYRADGRHVAASDVRLGDLLKAEGRHAEVTGLTLREDLQEMVIVELAAPHLYFAGIDLLLSHNAIQKP